MEASTLVNSASTHLSQKGGETNSIATHLPCIGMSGHSTQSEHATNLTMQ